MLIRQATTNDYFTTENLTREAFWNVYKPGCNEHLVLHNFRQLPDFIKELDCVGEVDGKIIAHIMYFKTVLVGKGGERYPAIGFGPVSVLPELQGKGYGGEIIRYTLAQAEEMGYSAVLITDNPDLYHRFGFESATRYRVFYTGVPETEEAPFFMIKFLTGDKPDCDLYFTDPDGYMVSPEDVDKFDKQFPPKVKEKRPGQLF